MNFILRNVVVFGLFFLMFFVSWNLEITVRTQDSNANPLPPHQSQVKAKNDPSVRKAKASAERAVVEARLWELRLNDSERTQATHPNETVLNWSWSDNGRYYGNVHVYSAHGRPVAIV